MTSEAERELIERARPLAAEIIGEIDELKAENERLRAAIREHRDQKFDDRCWIDDRVLYEALGESQPDLTLPPACEFLESCRRYWDQRQSPVAKMVSQSSKMTIGQLERELASLRGALEGAALREARLSAELDEARRPPSHVVARPGGRFDLFDSGSQAHAFDRARRGEGWHSMLVGVSEWTRHPDAASSSREALGALALRRPPRFREPAGEGEG